MTEAPPLLVPMSMQALLVNEKVRNSVVFERWTNVYRSLNEFDDPVPAPGQNLQPPPLGVHLHWKLPSALTRGSAPSGSTKVTYPLTPNRWMIARLSTKSGSTVAQQLKAWILQSDYLDDKGSSPFADPASPRGNVKTTGLGKRVPIEEWQGDVGGKLFLRATGTADVTFTAYQPGVVDVYSFIDDMKDVAENTLVTYLVAGWYSDPKNDPLVEYSLEKLGWTIFGGGGATPSTSVYHSMIHSMTWQTSTPPAPPRIDSDATSMQIGVGYTAIDALAAVLNARAGKPAGSDIERKLEAFQYGVLQTLDGPDGSAQLELKIRQAWFGSSPGGTLWDIVAKSQGQTTSEALDRGSVPLPPPLTPQQEQWLAAMNVKQRDYDTAQRELMSMQWEVFALWWKQQRGPFVSDQQDAFGVDLDVILQWIDEALDATKSGSFVNKVLAAKDNVKTLRAALPDPTSQDSIDDFARKIPSGGSIQLTLRSRALPPFYHPADPVVLIAGITPPASDVDDSKPLPCRVATAATTGVRVNNTPVSETTLRIGSMIQIPATTKLPSTITAGIRALAVETYFADPNNAASIAMNGLNIGDSTVVNALAAAIGNGSAQISTIAQPLQASFAFAKWRQAWSPLFLQWMITWLPSVAPKPDGPFEPPKDARSGKSGGAQDNWPFIADDWKFDGGDRVMQRGSEYYQWTAGDVWTQTLQVQKQTYTGRTFLTPQATSLFIRRLADHVKLHPDRDLSDILKLIDDIGETRFLSQTLSGFNAAFLMRSLQQTPPPPPNTPVGNAIGDEFHGVPFVAKGDQKMAFGGGSPFFFPVRGGFFQFESLQIVDAFGQTIDLLWANGNAGNRGDKTKFRPLRGAGTVPDAGSGIAEEGRRIKQAPRVVQPNRLDLRLLDATNDAQEIFFTPGASPVCGWLLPNHLDQSIAVYDAPGNPLGEMLVLADATGNRKVTWLPAPNVENPVTDPAQIGNPHLKAMLSAFTSASGGIQGDRAAAFRALYTSIDETLWMVDPTGGHGDQDLAVLIGRPLALVRAQLQFELFGRPAVNQSWRDSLQQQTSGSTTVPFPIRLGSTELLDDGLIGYYGGNTYTSFNAVHPSTSASSPYVAAIGAGNYISLQFNHPSYQTQNVTLLLDPFGTVHATTGVLPAARLSLPPQFFQAALAKMAVTFRTGPVLTTTPSIRIPMPAERNGTWSWIRHVTPGVPKSNWKVDPILAAGQEARLDDKPPHLLDGWLQFQPKDIAPKE